MFQGQIVPFISVVIPARNEELYIKACLQSVLAQSYPRELMEILVVDNGSTDRTSQIAAGLLEMDGRGRVLYKAGGTIASVRNYGWLHARGEILAFLDGDSVVEVDWLLQGVRLLLSDANISCVGFALAPPSSEDSWVEKGWFPISSSGKHRGTKEVRWLSSFNLMIKRIFFEQIGGFDESMVTCEDADLGNRLSVVSRLIFSDCSRVKHLGTVKTLREFLCKEYWRGQNSMRSFLTSTNKLSEALSVFVPLAYLIMWCIWLVTAMISLVIVKGTQIWVILGLLIILLPFGLAWRAGIRNPVQFVYVSILYMFYLLARGTAIVSTR